MEKDKPESYGSKRRSGRSPEPAGARAAKRATGEAPVFVIQKHDASTLHYDLRLEIGGRLKSWAVPKGPSTDPRDKRLAIETEDHPMDYAGFEGVIPPEEYGGGTVLVWDRGSYRNLKIDDQGHEKTDMQAAYDDGHLSVWLEGEKLRGGYSLTHFRTEKNKKQWLLVKMNDTAADARRNPVKSQPKSVKTQRTVAQVAREDQIARGADES